MKKILIFGASGSGCSTLGKVLSEELQLPFFDSDDYFWIKTDPPFQKSRDYQEARELLRRDVEGLNEWVLSGSQILAEIVKKDLDVVVFLYVPNEARIERLKMREVGRFGDKVNPGGAMFEQHMQFMKWAAAYDDPQTEVRNIEMHEQWMEKLTCHVVKIEGTDTIEENLKKILKQCHF